MKNLPQVSIIILNWNGWKDTLECLESLFQIKYPNYNIIVIDNGSTDNSINKIRWWAEGKIVVKSKIFKDRLNINKPITLFEVKKKDINKKIDAITNFLHQNTRRGFVLIHNEKNYGFAKGNNIGMNLALKIGADYVLLLNNDTVVDPYFLSELIKVVQNNKQIGIASPFVYWYDSPDQIQHGGEKIRKFLLKSIKLWKKYPNKQIIISETAAGSCMLISRENIIKTGYLPVEFSFLLADLGYSFKTRLNGFLIVSVRNAKIWHKTSRSTDKVKPVTVKSQIKEGIIFKYLFFKKEEFLLSLLLSVFFYWPIRLLKFLFTNKGFLRCFI